MVGHGVARARLDTYRHSTGTHKSLLRQLHLQGIITGPAQPVTVLCSARNGPARHVHSIITTPALLGTVWRGHGSAHTGTD
jgi:hypothetical protein